MKEEQITITVAEAAKIIGVGQNKMLEIVKIDNFPAVSFGRKILIDKKKFIKWFSSLTDEIIIINK